MSGLSKTNIEYGELNWNFYPGCLHKQQGICPLPNCWAEGMSKRKLEDFHKPHLIPERLLAPLSRKKPARILVNFMGDLMGDWVDPEQIVLIKEREESATLKWWVKYVLRNCPQHQFFFLTKNPTGYAKWGEWPDNAWLGATVCNDKMNAYPLPVVKAKHKWLSIEPLLSHVVANPESLVNAGIDWVVIGAQSSPKLMPEISWVREIVEACDAAGVKVWLKENLRNSFQWPRDNWAYKVFGDGKLRQELPV